MTALDDLAARRDPSLLQLVSELGGRGGVIRQQVSAAAKGRVRIDGRSVINFAAANYLGLAGHPAVRQEAAFATRRWPIALSQPRFLATDALTVALEWTLARLVDQERALLFTSTLHAAQDVLPRLAGPRGALFLDECAYPISAAAARATGATTRRFAHNDPADLGRRLRRCGARDKVIVCDGLYMSEGEPAPLTDFCALAERHGATIYVDDAQGLGLMGHGPDRAMTYGRGGGGVMAYTSAPSGRVVYVATLAKALGIPLAFVAGPAVFIDHLQAAAFTHTHNSPPALPVVAAALAAVRLHALQGDWLRGRLLERVRQFRAGLTQGAGLATPHEWPEQAIYTPTAPAALRLGRRLRRAGMWPVVQFRPADNPGGGAVRLLFSAHHAPAEVERLVEVISTCLPE